MIAGKEWHLKSLSKEDLQKIGEAVHNAEQKTSGEIIPMIVKSSTSTRQVVWVLTFVIFVLLTLLNLDQLIWQFGSPPQWYYLALLLASILVAKPLTFVPGVNRFFLNPADANFDVNQRAELEFYRGRFQHTSKRTGILIFVSILERQVVVLADSGISSKLPAETWQAIVQGMIFELKQNRMAAGLTKAIEKCGEILANHFPAEFVNPNEISNQLVMKE